MNIDEILSAGPVIPVIVIERASDAVSLARALASGGVKVLEITLRTPAALDAIRAIRAEVDGVVVGAGTILNARDLDRALAAGAEFGVSPGITPSLLSEVRQSGLAFLPGVATLSVMAVSVSQDLSGSRMASRFRWSHRSRNSSRSAATWMRVGTCTTM